MKLWAKTLISIGGIGLVAGAVIGGVYGFNATHQDGAKYSSGYGMSNDFEGYEGYGEANGHDINREDFNVYFSDPADPYWHPIAAYNFENNTVNDRPVQEWLDEYARIHHEMPFMHLFYGAAHFENDYAEAITPAEFVEYAEWFLENTPWSGDLGSLTVFRIARGVKRSGGMITLGERNSISKEENTITFYPDAFFGSLPAWVDPMLGEAQDALTIKLGDGTLFTKEEIEEIIRKADEIETAYKAADINNLDWDEDTLTPEFVAKNYGLTYHRSIDFKIRMLRPVENIVDPSNPQRDGQMGYEVYIDAYPELFDEVFAIQPYLQDQLNGPHIDYSDVNYPEGKWVDGPYEGIQLNSRIPYISVAKAASPETWKGIGIDWLKYVGSHEYGHHTTLTPGADMSENPVYLGAFTTRSGPSYSNAYDQDVVNLYLKLRTSLQVGAVGSQGRLDGSGVTQPGANTEGKLFPWFYWNDNGVYHPETRIDDPNTQGPQHSIWGSDVDVPSAISSSGRAIKTLDEMIGDAAQGHSLSNPEINPFDAFIANAWDSQSGSLNPRIKAPALVYDERGNLIPVTSDYAMNLLTGGEEAHPGWYDDNHHLMFAQNRAKKWYVPTFGVGEAYMPGPTLFFDGERDGVGEDQLTNPIVGTPQPIFDIVPLLTNWSDPAWLRSNFNATNFPAFVDYNPYYDFDDWETYWEDTHGEQPNFTVDQFPYPGVTDQTADEVIALIEEAKQHVANEYYNKDITKVQNIQGIMFLIDNFHIGENSPKNPFDDILSPVEREIFRPIYDEFYRLSRVAAKPYEANLQDFNNIYVDVFMKSDIFSALKRQYSLVGWEGGDTDGERERAFLARLDNSFDQVYTDYTFSFAEAINRDLLQIFYEPATEQFWSVPDYVENPLSEASSGMEFFVDGSYTQEYVIKTDDNPNSYIDHQSLAWVLKDVFRTSSYPALKDHIVAKNGRAYFTGVFGQEVMSAVMNFGISTGTPILTGSWALPSERLPILNNVFDLHRTRIGVSNSMTNGFFKDDAMRRALGAEVYALDGTPMPLPTGINGGANPIVQVNGQPITTIPQAIWTWFLRSKGIGDVNTLTGRERTLTGIWRDSYRDADYLWGYIPLQYADDVRYLRFEDIETGEVKTLSVHTGDNNLFYIPDRRVTGSDRRHHIEDDRYTSWTSDFAAMGGYVDGLLETGHQYRISFANENFEIVNDASGHNLFSLGSRNVIAENGKAEQQAPIVIRNVNGEAVIVVNSQFNR